MSQPLSLFSVVAAATVAAALSSVGAQAASKVSTDLSGVSSHRAAALKECNEAGGKLLEYVWGHQQDDRVRTCMVQKGEPE